MMMIDFIRRNLTSSIFNHTCSRSPTAFSFPVRLISTSTDAPNVLDILLRKHKFPSELASRVAPELSYLKNPEKAGPILSFLRNSGFSDSQLIRIVKQRPRFFTASLEDSIKPKIKFFRDLGLSFDEIAKIVSSSPAILHLSLENNIIPSLSLLNGLLGSNDKASRFIARSPRSLSVNFEKTVMPNVEFFKSCGIPMHRICSVLNSSPSVFSMKPEDVRKSAEKVREMGIDASCNSFIYAVLYNKAWDTKLQGYRDLGFSDRDILAMFRKEPEVFCGSMEKIKKIVELFLATGKFDLSSIVGFPHLLRYSVEKRYIPRLRILGILESRNLIVEWPSVGIISTSTDAKFFEKFISPYLNDISDVYITNNFVGAKGMKCL